MSDPNAPQILLEAIKTRVTEVFPAQIRECLDQLSDDEIWTRPNEQSNSIGNLVLHLTGSLNHYLNRNIGGMEFTRDRAAEFAERRRIPKAELRAAFDEMVARARITFSTIDVPRLSAPATEPKMNQILFEDIYNVSIHIATHTGQILWITKMLRGGGLDDLWIKTHRQLGAWRTA